MTATTLVGTIPPIERDEAQRLARTEYARVADLLRSLGPDDWGKPTDCPLWDVRAVAGHTAGMLATFTGYRTMMRDVMTATRKAKRSGAPMIDMLTDKQVADHASLSTSDVVDKIERVGPEAAQWRTTRPGWFRRMRMDEEVGGKKEKWRMGYLLEVILTRDPWMHRVDIARATGRDLALTADHDGRIVADVVAEWARRHSRPCTLTLTGPAGGTYATGDDGGAGEHVEVDAVEFCRTLAGRSHGTGLLSQEVPF